MGRILRWAKPDVANELSDAGDQPGDPIIPEEECFRRLVQAVTDYAMPQTTGADLAREVSALRPGLPVILATGYAELPSGAALNVIRLPKPFNQLELGRALSEETGAVRRDQ